MSAEVHVEPRVHEGAAEHGHGAEARRRAENLGKEGREKRRGGPIITFVHSICVSRFFQLSQRSTMNHYLKVPQSRLGLESRQPVVAVVAHPVQEYQRPETSIDRARLSVRGPTCSGASMYDIHIDLFLHITSAALIQVLSSNGITCLPN